MCVCGGSRSLFQHRWCVWAPATASFSWQLSASIFISLIASFPHCQLVSLINGCFTSLITDSYLLRSFSPRSLYWLPWLLAVASLTFTPQVFQILTPNFYLGFFVPENEKSNFYFPVWIANNTFYTRKKKVGVFLLCWALSLIALHPRVYFSNCDFKHDISWQLYIILCEILVASFLLSLVLIKRFLALWQLRQGLDSIPIFLLTLWFSECMKSQLREHYNLFQTSARRHFIIQENNIGCQLHSKRGATETQTYALPSVLWAPSTCPLRMKEYTSLSTVNLAMLPDFKDLLYFVEEMSRATPWIPILVSFWIRVEPSRSTCIRSGRWKKRRLNSLR